jgi:5'-nucleotidase
MRCVITNDDGADAPGLRALHTALRGFADVVVVAPAIEWSGSGHGAPSREPMPVERRRDVEMGEIYVVHGQPADCIRLAMTALVRPAPDLVVSGINRGSNLGVDLYYSGTVGAAREAFILGCPAIAVSQLLRKDLPEDWTLTMKRAAAVLERLVAEIRSRKKPSLWNVNLPHLPPGGRVRGVAMAPMAATPLEMLYEHTDAGSPNTGDAHAIYRYTASYFRRPQPAGSDVERVFGDWVGITELTTDLTNASMERSELAWPIE